jgi:hypothetical protein
MRHHRGIPDEERRPFTHVDEVVDWLHGRPADLRRLDRDMAIGVGRLAVREAGVGEVAFPELAGLQAVVLGVAQQPRNRRRVTDEGMHLGAIDALGRIVAADAMLMRIEPRQERRQRGAAKRRRHIAIREHGAVTRQPIEPRRADDLVPHKAEVAPVHVVADHHDDIGRSLVIAAEQGQRGREHAERAEEGAASDGRLHGQTS